METHKIIHLPPPIENKKNKKIEPKPKKKRLITETNTWNTFLCHPSDFQIEPQKKSLEMLLSPTTEISLAESKKMHFLKEQIRQKINGYKAQDIKKGIFDISTFIDLEYVLQLLRACELTCFYCKESVFIWYEISRESKQWSIERIDNKIGHNIGNVEIACLSCNLKRRCMYHERFVFTKQLNIVKC